MLHLYLSVARIVTYADYTFLFRTYKMAINGIFSDLEGHVGLCCGCFPAMSFIIKLVTNKLGAGSNGVTKTTQSNHRVHTIPRRIWRRRDRGIKMRTMDVGTEDGDSQRAILVAAEADAGDSAHHKRRGIHKTTDFTVTEENISTSDRDATIPAHVRLARSWDAASS